MVPDQRLINQLAQEKSDITVKTNKKDLKSKFEIEISGDNKKLPNIYWLPKLNKNPIKFRFIIAALKCSVKSGSFDKFEQTKQKK